MFDSLLSVLLEDDLDMLFPLPPRMPVFALATVRPGAWS